MKDTTIQAMKEHMIHVGPSAEFAKSHVIAAANSAGPGSVSPSHEAIAKRAYEIYTQHGRKKGHCKQNWQQAERDLKYPVDTTFAIHECECEQTQEQKAGFAQVVNQATGPAPSGKSSDSSSCCNKTSGHAASHGKIRQ